MVSIYTISLENNPNNIVYIGKTKNSLEKRLKEHIYKAKKAIKNHKFSNWIKKQINLEHKILIELLEEVNDSDWEMAEIYWIAQFKAWGFNLKNVDTGGVLSNVSTEQREVLVKRFKNRIITEEYRNFFRALANTREGKEKIKKAQEASKHKIIQIDILTGEKIYWSSVTEAAKQYFQTKDPISAIGKVLKGKRKTYKKCYWIYQ